MQPSLLVRLWREAWGPGVLLVAIFAAWEIAARFNYLPAYLLPGPSTVFARAWEVRDDLAVHTAVTLLEIVVSFLLSIVVGITLALLIVYVRAFEKIVYPLIVLSQAIPKVALAPLFVIWFGFGFLPKIVIGVLVAFFPILIDVVVGIRSADPEAIHLLKSLGAGRWKIFYHLQMPNALPNLFGALKVAVTLATIGAIVAEFIGANDGLGYVLIVSNGVQDMPLLFAALILISILAVLLYLLTGWVERVAVQWHVSHRAMGRLGDVKHS